MSLKACPRGAGGWLVAGVVLFMGLVAAGTAVQAQVLSCPARPVYPLPNNQSSLESLLAQQNAMALSCLKDAGFYSWRGAVLLALRMPEAALEDLERALLLEPDLPGAKLDYAQALMETGDTLSARGLLEQLAERPDLPAHLQPLIARALSDLQPAHPLRDWRSRWVLTTALGADTNLNNAPTATELTLSFAQGPVTLPLQDSARPQRGGASLLAAQWQAVKPQGEHLWSLQADVRSRQTALATARYQQADLSAGWLQAPEAPSQWIARAGLTRVDMGGLALLRNVRASVLHQWQPRPLAMSEGLGADCRRSLGVELERSRYPSTVESNGRYAGLVANVSCVGTDDLAAQGLFGRQQVHFQLRRGSDHALDAARAGGNYLRTEFRAVWEAMSGPYKWNADYGYTRQSDGAGYSPLLQNNLRRTASRHSLRLELSRALPRSATTSWTNGAEMFVSAETSRQNSNLDAFLSNQSALYIGMRWTLP